jgi:hypothetical protein
MFEHLQSNQYKDWDESNDLYFHDNTQKLFYNKDFVFPPTHSEQVGELKTRLENLEKFVQNVLKPGQTNQGIEKPGEQTAEPKSGLNIKNKSIIEPDQAQTKLSPKRVPKKNEKNAAENIVKMVRQAAVTIHRQSQPATTQRPRNYLALTSSRFGTQTAESTDRDSPKKTRPSKIQLESRSFNRTPSQTEVQAIKYSKSGSQETITPRTLYFNKTTNQFYQSSIRRKGTLKIGTDDSSGLPDLVRWNNKYDKAFLTPQELISKKVMFPIDDEEASGGGGSNNNEGLFLTSVSFKEKSGKEKAEALRRKVSLGSVFFI